jgi:hypothetical protein
VSIPIDTYFTIDPSSEFKSKAHGILFSQELFFYVSDTSELRVRNFNGLVAYTVAQNCIWAAAFSASDRVQLYYATVGGNIFYIPYFHFGSGTLDTVEITGLVAPAVTFDVFYCVNSNPPVYTMVVDDGVRHTLYVANDSAFTSIRATEQIYTNTTDPTHYVQRPRIAMHPEDTDIMTVHVQKIVVQTGASGTGFYTVRIPSVA